MQACANGHENPGENAFCGTCGAPLKSTSAPGSAAATEALSIDHNPVTDRIDITAATFRIERNTGAFGNDDWLLIQFDIANKGPADAIAVQFQLEVTDIFGDTIFAGHWNFDSRIRPGTTAKTDRNGGWELNRFIPDHVRLMGMDRNQLRLKVTPLRAAFADGVVLSL